MTKSLSVVALGVTLGAGLLFAEGQVLWQQGGIELCAGTAYAGTAAVADSCGGAVVIWIDNRPGFQSLYAQRVSGEGESLWRANGVSLRETLGQTAALDAVSDGSGGAVVALHHQGGVPGGTRITAQRVDSAGNAKWGTLGTTVNVAYGDVAFSFALVADEHGGAYVAWWLDTLGQGDDTLTVSRIDSLGAIRWTSVLSDIPSGRPAVCADRQGGATVVWEARDGGSCRVKAQRLDDSGTELWAHGGVLVSTQGYDQVAGLSVLATDDGFVTTWSTQRGSDWRVWAQKLDTNGHPAWSDSGRGVSTTCPGHNGIWAVKQVSGADRRTVCLWQECRDSFYVMLGQSLDSSGNRIWDTTGVVLGPTLLAEHRYFAGMTDARGGAIAAWLVNSGGDWDILSQRIDPAGRLCWGDSGLWVCNDTSVRQWEPTTAPDGCGGAIVAWRSWSSIWAQRLADVDGVGERASLAWSRPFHLSCSSPTRGRTVIGWPTGLGRVVAIFDASGRHVTTLTGASSGTVRWALWDGRDSHGRKCPTGAYFCTTQGAATMSRTCKVLLIAD